MRVARKRSNRCRIGWRIVVLLCAALYAATTRAEVAPEESGLQVWLNPGVYSYHFDSSKGLRNNNIGFGAEVLLANNHGLMAGSIINSKDARTHYAAYEWRPFHWHFSSVNVSAAIALGAFDGYPNYHDGGWFIAPLPFLAVEGKRFGANISVIPTIANRFDGAIAVQVKMRVW